MSKKDKRIGNKFWELRSKHGRDKLFNEPQILLEAAQDYFKWCDDNPLYKNEMIKGGDMASEIIPVPIMRPYTLQGLTIYLGVNRKYLDDFESSIKDKTDDKSKDYSQVITYIREVIYNQKFEGASIGAFNANIISRDLGLIDKQDLKADLNANIDAKVQTNIDYSKLSTETLTDLLNNIQKND